MTKRLNNYEHRVLRAKLQEIDAAVQSAQIAMQTASLSHSHVDDLTQAHGILAGLCADFGDRHWEAVDMGLLARIEATEEFVSDLLDHITAADRIDKVEPITPGRYAVWRTVTINGRPHVESAMCSNPAVGFAQLDAWETDLRRNALPASSSSSPSP